MNTETIMTQVPQVAVLRGQMTKIENTVGSLTIETQEDYAQAADVVAKLKELGSSIKDTKEAITKPLNESLKNIRTLFKPIEDQFENAEMVVKSKILAYKKKVDEEAREKEAKIAEKVEQGKMKLETAEKKMDAIERVEQTTRGKTGEVQIRKVRKVRITDETKLPRQYLIPDMVAIRKDALAGVAIDGVEVYEEETVAAGSY